MNITELKTGELLPGLKWVQTKGMDTDGCIAFTIEIVPAITSSRLI